jgi:hypothetical protein
MGWIECLCLYNSDRPGGFFSLGVMIRCCCMYSILLCLRDDGAEAGRAGTELSRRAEVYQSGVRRHHSPFPIRSGPLYYAPTPTPHVNFCA